jgi:Ca2+-binding RTX toxin-like protein
MVVNTRLGTDGDDTIAGTDPAFDYKIYGYGGVDSLTGGQNNDTLYGGAEDDILSDRAGQTGKLYGGTGKDTFQIASATQNAIFDLFGGIGTDKVEARFISAAAQVNLVTGLMSQGSLTVNLTSIEIAEGGSWNDTLVGGDNHTLFGGGGSDNLSFIGGESSEAYGGDGGDTLLGQSGAETLDGGAGRDTVYGGGGADHLYAGDSGSGSALESLFGGNGDDVLDGDASSTATYFKGGYGNDTIFAGSERRANDVYYGGSGTDTADFAELMGNGVFRLGSAGTITFGSVVSDFAAIEKVKGSQGNDSMFGDAGANRLNGHIGNDSLYGGGGQDTLLGGDGDDILSINAGVAELYGGDDDDRLLVTNGISGGGTITGGTGTDTLEVTSTSGWDIDLAAEALVEAGNTMALRDMEIILGGVGDDTMTGDALANSLTGGRGDDALSGGNGADTLAGSDGDDTLLGGSGDDVFSIGTDGDADSIDGGSGKDSLALFGGFGWTLLATGIANEIDGQTSMTFAGIEVLTGTALGDVVEEDGSLNEISLKQGDDIIVDNGFSSLDDIFDGGTGSDTLDLSNATGAREVNLGTETFVGNGTLRSFENVVGGLFNDTLTGTTGRNTLSGAAGDDTLTGDLGNDSLFGGDGSDSVVGGTGFDLLEGGSLLDVLIGGDGNDTLVGGTGGDFMYGGANLDVLRGGDDGDRLFGGSFGDTLQGDGSNDTLTGGAGQDSMTGGTGVDRFVWTDITDGGLGEDADVISDFATGEDKLNLSAISGLTWIDTAAFSNVAGQVRQATSGGTTVISVDTDGNAVADMEIVLQMALTGIVAGDLLL